jgi:hypothetical protein
LEFNNFFSFLHSKWIKKINFNIKIYVFKIKLESSNLLILFLKEEKINKWEKIAHGDFLLGYRMKLSFSCKLVNRMFEILEIIIF